MKKKLLKKLLAFILIIFSVSFLHAQQCKGPNKILVCQCARYSDFICYYVCKCIHVSQLKEHLRGGWTLSDPSVAKESNTTSSDLFSTSVINSASINVALDKSQTVSLKIYDITGRLIKTLADSKKLQGEHQIEWNARDESGNAVPAGIYFLRMVA